MAVFTVGCGNERIAQSSMIANYRVFLLNNISPSISLAVLPSKLATSCRRLNRRPEMNVRLRASVPNVPKLLSVSRYKVDVMQEVQIVQFAYILASVLPSE